MRHNKLFWGSSYDRGLDVLLPMWPEIKEKYPPAQLHICYGWDLFDVAAKGNVERQNWKKRMQELMKQPGIFHHGRVGQKRLAEIRQSCGIWAYPTYFTEINCITALQAQADGLVPVTMTLAALDETVQSGIKINGKIQDNREEFLNALLSLMGNKKRWKSESKKAQKFAKSFTWSNIANQWEEEFKQSFNPKVSIITPTIRKGWWNIMANNIAIQTYKNIEWIIVDDYPTDRSNLAMEYADKYGLDIKYLRTKQKVKRFYSLSSANNTGATNASGELLVWLQDFVLMPPNGIERIVDLYRINRNSLIAPVDIYYEPKIMPNTDSEDWFNGEIDVLGRRLRKNQRITGQGIRISKQPAEFEMNYGAIPKHIYDRLNGFWEFFDEALGFDNTEIALRAIKLGYDVVVDDGNVAACIDHWKPLEDKPEELGVERTIRLNDPRFYWMIDQIKKGRMTYIRDPKIDEKIDLIYEIPNNLSQEEAVEYMKENMIDIIESWGDI